LDKDKFKRTSSKALTSIPPGATSLETESQYIILKIRKQTSRRLHGEQITKWEINE